MLAKRKMSVTELAEQVGITIINNFNPQKRQGESDATFDARSNLRSSQLPARRDSGTYRLK